MEPSLPAKFRPLGLWFDEQRRTTPLCFSSERLHWHLVTYAPKLKNFLEFRCALLMLERILPNRCVELHDDHYDEAWHSFLICHASIWRDVTSLYDKPYRTWLETARSCDPEEYRHMQLILAGEHWQTLDVSERLLVVSEVDPTQVRVVLDESLPDDPRFIEPVFEMFSNVWG